MQGTATVRVRLVDLRHKREALYALAASAQLYGAKFSEYTRMVAGKVAPLLELNGVAYGDLKEGAVRGCARGCARGRCGCVAVVHA